MEKESQDLPGGETFCKRDVDFMIGQNFDKDLFEKLHFGRKRLDCVQFKTC